VSRGMKEWELGLKKGTGQNGIDRNYSACFGWLSTRCYKTLF